MAANATPGLNAPTVAPTAAAPGAAPGGGLINASAGQTTNITGNPPSGAGVSTLPTVSGYDPAQATAANATATGYTPNGFAVAPEQTVAGQIKNIIASGSPLMQQAVANANAQMSQRGLINSSQAITAGQNALYAAAEPIAAADANTYSTAATNTVNAENQALAAEAAARNSASATNAQLDTQNSQYNAGAANAALGAEATASNNISAALSNIQANGLVSTQIQNLTDENKSLLQTSASAASVYQQALTNLNSIITNPNLNSAQQAQALNDQVAQLKDALASLQAIANNEQVTSNLDFTSGTNGPAAG